MYLLSIFNRGVAITCKIMTILRASVGRINNLIRNKRYNNAHTYMCHTHTGLAQCSAIELTTFILVISNEI